MSNDHTPTSEILQDIADTEQEIAQMRREISALEILGDRLSSMKADYRRSGIAERMIFVEKLRSILNERASPRSTSR